MKSYNSLKARQFVLLPATLLVAFANGCGGDPADPGHWIGRLDERAYRSEALEKLPKVIRDIEDDALRAEWEEKATAALVEAYDMDVQRNEILQALQAWKRPEAGKIFVRALTEWKDGVTDTLATTAAAGAGEMKLKEAVAPMLPMLEADSMFLRKGVVAALGDIGTPEVVEPLMKAMLVEASLQDFFINRVAAEKLGIIRDPRSVSALIRGLFMRGRGADLFPFAAPSVIALGPDVAQPALIEAIDAKNAELLAMAEKLKFNRIAISRKAFTVLGMFYEADAATKEFLTKAMESDEEDTKLRTYAAEALGRIGGDDMKELILKHLADPKVEVPAKLRLQVGLMQLADHSVVPLLLVQCSEKGIVKDLYGNPAHNLRIGAFEAITMLGHKEDIEKALAIIEATAAKAEKSGEMYTMLAEEFRKKMLGHEVVLECDQDAACYAGKLTSSSDVGKVAAWHIAVLKAEDQAPALIKALDSGFKGTRIGVAFALNRLAPAAVDPNDVWAAFNRDASEGRNFGTMQVYRDTLAMYWNLRRRKGK